MSTTAVAGRWSLVAGSTLLLLATSNQQLATAFAAEPQVRVAILQEVPDARLTILARCRVTDLATGKLLGEPASLKWQKVMANHTGLTMGRTAFPAEAIVLEPVEAATVRVNARPYRGSLVLFRTPAGRVTIVNRLALEDYLVSALASEVNPGWPLEVLKAHAVVSRTMVAHRIWIGRGQSFDVTADTAVHLYYGLAVERDATRQAVEETRGQVLAVGGELLSVTFHANCGGHTEDASELWVEQGDVSSLKGRPDPHCHSLRHFRWKTVVARDDLQACQVVERNRSGRARAVRLVDFQGERTISGRAFRDLLGPNRLRSLKFEVEATPSGLIFTGFGWGHGVGLCQWGAYGMAVRGQPMEEILAFYFPGAQLRRLQGLPGFDR